MDISSVRASVGPSTYEKAAQQTEVARAQAKEKEAQEQIAVEAIADTKAKQSARETAKAPVQNGVGKVIDISL